MNFINKEVWGFLEDNLTIFILLLMWSLFWKGLALWKSSRLSHKWWFIILLVANTLGILDIVYIFFISNRYSVESKEIEVKN